MAIKHSFRVTFVVPPSVYATSLVWDSTIRAPFEGTAIAVTGVTRTFGRDCAIRVIDLRVAPDQERHMLAGLQGGDIICVTGSPDGYRFVKGFSERVRQEETRRDLSRCPIVLGGTMATLSWATVLAKTKVDYCVVGECERALPELVRCILAGQAPAGLPVAFRDSDGRVVSPTPMPDDGVVDLDSVPCPDYGLWRDSHGDRLTETVCYSTQRGCPFGCEFCANPHGRHFRMASLPKIEADLRQLRDEQGFRSVCFNDPTFNTDPGRSVEVARVMARLKLPWVCLVRAQDSPYKLFKEFRDCG